MSTSSEQPRHETGSVRGDRDVRDTDGNGVPDRRTVVAREKEEHGGIKWGSAFFGWLTAAGTAILVTALLSAIGTAVGLGALSGPQQAEREATQNAQTVGLIGAIALLVVLFIAYYAGGYVAGRMARFDGAKQGIAVWLWALVIAIVVAVVVAVAGSEYNVLSAAQQPAARPDQRGRPRDRRHHHRGRGRRREPGRRDPRGPRRDAVPPQGRPHRTGFLTHPPHEPPVSPAGGRAVPGSGEHPRPSRALVVLVNDLRVPPPTAPPPATPSPTGGTRCRRRGGRGRRPARTARASPRRRSRNGAAA